jgi:ATP/maltotriose-dependent transcriptional regulator MalT
MLSITDLQDFMDLDPETVEAVRKATGLSEAEAIALAQQLLESEKGIYTLHLMFRDLLADAAAKSDLPREQELRRAYAYFARKYPMPHML